MLEQTLDTVLTDLWLITRIVFVCAALALGIRILLGAFFMPGRGPKHDEK